MTLRPPRILIADDDEILLSAMRIRLQALDVEVITATDGYNSLAKARSEKPDLLILDVNMPAGDGFSVQERLKGIEGLESVPVIYLTGDRSERLDDLARQVGGIALFHKPVGMQKLVETIRTALSPSAA